MTKLNEIDKNLKCSEEDRLELRNEIRHNKNENQDNYYCLARATRISYNRCRREREKHIKKDMAE